MIRESLPARGGSRFFIPPSLTRASNILFIPLDFNPASFMRESARFKFENLSVIKSRLFHWAAMQQQVSYLDSNEHRPAFCAHSWELLIGAGSVQTLAHYAGTAFEQLKTHQSNAQDWLFGVFSYDLKNEVEQLTSQHPDGVGFPDICFFQPQIVIGIRHGRLEVEIHALGLNPANIWDEVMAIKEPALNDASVPVHLHSRVQYGAYLSALEAIRSHIVEGDLYEMNYCQEFFAENTRINPKAVWLKLNTLSRAPMAAYFRWNDLYLLCASPERFIKKEGNRLMSQPIKGTRKRAGALDEEAKQSLAVSEKDRAENVMIVDLTRNDLARSCMPGSVQVDELFGVYTFETVHQMISTVSGRLRPGIDPIDAFRAAFPPGSMTGAPKVMAMELIEKYEVARRGIYSGALGYFDPNGDFDFNVVIRSILYNASNAYVSAQVGGAIVFDSVAESEYEECLVKAAALFKALE
ncbi:MAG: anthranilate synthase component I family protein [Saprospiraceae bacterium]|nr:anthranilate synthase component I family protein [Saprospiraceae bacterium]